MLLLLFLFWEKSVLPIAVDGKRVYAVDIEISTVVNR
jgi:hypothetical protein